MIFTKDDIRNQFEPFVKKHYVYVPYKDDYIADPQWNSLADGDVFSKGIKNFIETHKLGLRLETDKEKETTCGCCGNISNWCRKSTITIYGNNKAVMVLSLSYGQFGSDVYCNGKRICYTIDDQLTDVDGFNEFLNGLLKFGKGKK